MGAGSVSGTEPGQEYRLPGRALALVLPREGTSTCPYVTRFHRSGRGVGINCICPIKLTKGKGEIINCLYSGDL